MNLAEIQELNAFLHLQAAATSHFNTLCNLAQSGTPEAIDRIPKAKENLKESLLAWQNHKLAKPEDLIRIERIRQAVYAMTERRPTSLEDAVRVLLKLVRTQQSSMSPDVSVVSERLCRVVESQLNSRDNPAEPAAVATDKAFEPAPEPEPEPEPENAPATPVEASRLVAGQPQLTRERFELCPIGTKVITRKGEILQKTGHDPARFETDARVHVNYEWIAIRGGAFEPKLEENECLVGAMLLTKPDALVWLTSYEGALAIHIEGYGRRDMLEAPGPVVYVRQYSSSPKSSEEPQRAVHVMVYDDIQNYQIGEMISLVHARECERLPDAAS